MARSMEQELPRSAQTPGGRAAGAALEEDAEEAPPALPCSSRDQQGPCHVAEKDDHVEISKMRSMSKKLSDERRAGRVGRGHPRNDELLAIDDGHVEGPQT